MNQIQRYEEYKLTGEIKPYKFKKPVDGWESSELNKWKYECNLLYSKDYSLTKEQRKAYRDANKDQAKLYKKEYNKTNAQQVKTYRQGYRQSNKGKIKEYNASYSRTRREDQIVRIKEQVGNRIRKVLCGSKSKKTEEILGCSKDFFIDYISSLMTVDMTMDNYGTYWVIDHIIPQSSYKFCEGSDKEYKDRIIKLNHYTNLRPLTKLENARKLDKIEDIE